ncbi:MAG: glycosyltransferase [Acetobacteraceae bacterium]
MAEAEARADTAAAEADERAALAEARAAAALARVEALERSRSWRVTRPLRALGHAVRGHPGLALMEAGVPRARVEAWKAAWLARRGGNVPAAETPPAAPPPEAPPAPRRDGRRAICVDVTLTLRHGDRPAVGLVRVEHDVARHLLAPGTAAALPVLCDATGRYRPLTAAERDRLDAILDGGRPVEPMPGAAPNAEAHLAAARWAEGMALVRRVAKGDPALRASIAGGLRSRGGLPRWLAAAVAGGGVLGARAACALLDRPARQNVAPPAAPAAPPPPLPEGAVLVSAGNQWDYLDYAWLAREVRSGRLSAVTVLYDVIAADMPWTTPAPPDLYHRHWVEIGHVSKRLVAISEHTARQYRALIGAPNLIEVPIDACPLPLAFVERARAMAPVPVPSLQGRRFVLYVSTIETRKNHQLLLHAWDRLLREMPPEAVPQLVLVGAWGWGTEATRLMVERNWRIAQHVQVLSGVPDETLLWLYRHAMFAVFPALAEGFGLGAAEAVALGTPCLVSDCPALTEATQGLMPALDPLDLPGWVAELRRLFTDAAALEALRARTAEFVPLPDGAFREAVAQAAMQVAEAR